MAVAGVARHAIAAAAGRIVAATAAIPSGNALVHATPLVVAAPVAAAPVAATVAAAAVAPPLATPVPAAAVAAPLVIAVIAAAPAVALEASATIPVRAFAAARVAVVTATPRGVFAAVMAPTTVALGLASRDEAHHAVAAQLAVTRVADPLRILSDGLREVSRGGGQADIRRGALEKRDGDAHIFLGFVSALAAAAKRDAAD